MILRGNNIDQILDSIFVCIERCRVRVIGGFEKRHSSVVLSQRRPECYVSGPDLARRLIIFRRKFVLCFAAFRFGDQQFVLAHTSVKDAPMDAEFDGPGRLARGTELAVIRRGPHGGLRNRSRENDLRFVLCLGCTNAEPRRSGFAELAP